MKNWILIVMFALLSLLALGCMSEDTSTTTDDPTIEEPATSTTESDVTLSCSGRCTVEYNQCLSDGISACDCGNARIICRRACGYPGLLEQC